MTTPTVLSLDALRPQFNRLLEAAGTAPDAPTLPATWRAFAAFSQLSVACDDEALFFECGPSPPDERRFYVHFTRTFFGRDAGNHFWSSEVNCDFLFLKDAELEEISQTIEAEELAVQPDAREAFFHEVNDLEALWTRLENRAPLSTTIYIGES